MIVPQDHQSNVRLEAIRYHRQHGTYQTPQQVLYHPVQQMRATTFTLVVDDFAIKYATHQDCHHLLQALRAQFTISTDWGASLYIVIRLKLDYTAGHVDLPMPKYVTKTLHKFKNSL